MEKVADTRDYIEKFCKLSEENQRYILAIQQALIFAQRNESSAVKQKDLK